MTNQKRIIYPILMPKSLTTREVNPKDPEMAHHLAIGSILGDGSLTHVKGKTPVLEVENKSPSYTLWKRTLFVEAGIRDQVFRKRIDSRFDLPLTPKTSKKEDGKFFRSFYFASKAMFGGIWREAFYVPLPNQNKRAKFRKRIPSNIEEIFWGDLALAIFFLDDGWYVHGRHTAAFSAGSFTRDECALLVKCLNNNFGIESIVYPLDKNDKEPHHIYIQPWSYSNFQCRVEPWIQKLQAFKPNYSLNTAMKNKIAPRTVLLESKSFLDL